jgi:hypothetical protein
MFVLFGLTIPLIFPDDDRSVDEEDEADGDEDDLGDCNTQTTRSWFIKYRSRIGTRPPIEHNLLLGLTQDPLADPILY